jgi:hypothetical protein
LPGIKNNLKKYHITAFVGAVRQSSLGTPAIIGPLISAPDDDDNNIRAQQLLEQELVGETEVVGENLPQCQAKPSKHVQQYDADVCGNMDNPVGRHAIYGSTSIKNS